MINDEHSRLWNHVGCEVRPSAMVFAPNERPLLIFEGENHIQHLEIFVEAILKHYQSDLSASIVEGTAQQKNPFAYPSHLCVTNDKHLCVSFAGSNQLIYAQLDGRVIVK